VSVREKPERNPGESVSVSKDERFLTDDKKLIEPLRDMSPKSQEIVDDLRAWCDQENDRESLAGKVVGVERETVKNWLMGQQEPTLEEIILVQEFLAKQENWKKSA
jgi:hypothetical protein